MKLRLRRHSTGWLPMHMKCADHLSRRVTSEIRDRLNLFNVRNMEHSESQASSNNLELLLFQGTSPQFVILTLQDYTGT